MMINDQRQQWRTGRKKGIFRWKLREIASSQAPRNDGEMNEL